jgi:hypothetical protein
MFKSKIYLYFFKSEFKIVHTRKYKVEKKIEKEKQKTGKNEHKKKTRQHTGNTTHQNGFISWDKFTRRKGQGGIGFKDLDLFNQALLARQAWRLIAFPDSLCAIVLKAKYFPNGELTDAAFVKNPSPGWQGIMHGLELLKKGVIWRIGNGRKVRIWRDNWIPRGEMKATENATNSRVRRVTNLINQEDHTWKEDYWKFVKKFVPSILLFVNFAIK